jgi:high affinity Mn2+ porin
LLLLIKQTTFAANQSPPNNRKVKFSALSIYLLLVTISLFAGDSLQQKVNLHFQTTYIYQYKPEFHAAYSGPNSIGNKEEKQNSLTATLYLGMKLWKGAEIYINPELAGGSGLSGAFGMAASTNGETFRVGDPAPTLYLARGYFKQIFSLNKNVDTVADGQNQLGEIEHTKNLAINIGKFSLGDFFDVNECSGSPRTQFMNWALMSNAAWDYAANLRGYTVGAVIVLKYDNYYYRLGLSAEPKVANGSELNTDYGMARGLYAEIDKTYKLNKKEGHIRLLGYRNETNMGLYSQAINTIDTNGRPNLILTEKFGRTKTGFGINADQQINDNLTAFARIGWNDGKTETWAFTEADRTISLGISLKGQKWKRADDNIGIAVVMNGLSTEHKNYLAAGGLGFQLGDGKLNYSNETVAEIYYSCKPLKTSGFWLSGDYQFALNPGYNKDRGPVQALAFRLHVEL